MPCSFFFCSCCAGKSTERNSATRKPSGPALSDAAVDFRQFTFLFLFWELLKNIPAQSGESGWRGREGAASLLVEYKRKRSFFCLTLFYTADVSKRIIKESIYRLVCRCQEAAAATHNSRATFVSFSSSGGGSHFFWFLMSQDFFSFLYSSASLSCQWCSPHPKRRRYGTIGWKVLIISHPHGFSSISSTFYPTSKGTPTRLHLSTNNQPKIVIQYFNRGDVYIHKKRETL